MSSLRGVLGGWQALAGAFLIAGATLAPARAADEPKADPAAEAQSPSDMKPYKETIRNTDVTFGLVPVPGGEFVMGSPEGEEGRNEDEGPQHKVKIDPFWIGTHEVTWDEYDIWSYNLDIQRRKLNNEDPTKLDAVADLVTRPTKPYTDMSFGMGQRNFPAICMTQHAAKMYCQWLSEKTGHYYRLPTEAEWEYAARAGTTTAYSFGDDPAQLGDYAWYEKNAKGKYQKVGQKKPNPWGLFDIHGNVAEWCLDKYEPDFYAQFKDGVAVNPVCIPQTEYPRVARGGGWDSDPELLRSAARMPSSDEWKIQDPNLPKSVWYMTDALHVGFRVVRPFKVPTAEERKEKYFDAILPTDARENPNRKVDQ